MIQARAYEIYVMRGGMPGGEAQDWFKAESEVLAFLIADESSRAEETADQAPAITEQASVAASDSSDSSEPPKSGKPKPRARSKPAAVKEAAARKRSTKKAATKKSGESPAPKRTRKREKAEDNAR